MGKVGNAQPAGESLAEKLAKAQREAQDQAKHNREVAEREQRRATEGKGPQNPLTPNASLAPAEHESETYNAGQENPVTQPFLTAQDLEEYAEAREQYESGLRNLDQNYESTKHQDEYEEAEIEKGRVASKENANWDLAGRGLFRSSIRDADLADIDATAEIKRKFLSTQLQALKVYNEGQKTTMEAKWNRYEESKHRKEVENASEVDASMPKWKVEPGWEKLPAAATPKPAAAVVKPKFKANEPIGFNPGNQKSTNGGISAPAPNPSVSPGKPAAATNHVGTAQKALGKLYG